MRRLNTLRGIISAEDVNLICPHEHLFIDMTHEAVEPKTEAEKKLFYSDICMNNLCALRRNPYISYTNSGRRGPGGGGNQVPCRCRLQSTGRCYHRRCGPGYDEAEGLQREE